MDTDTVELSLADLHAVKNMATENVVKEFLSLLINMKLEELRHNISYKFYIRKLRESDPALADKIDGAMTDSTELKTSREEMSKTLRILLSELGKD